MEKMEKNIIGAKRSRMQLLHNLKEAYAMQGVLEKSLVEKNGLIDSQQKAIEMMKHCQEHYGSDVVRNSEAISALLIKVELLESEVQKLRAKPFRKRFIMWLRKKVKGKT